MRKITSNNLMTIKAIILHVKETKSKKTKHYWWKIAQRESRNEWFVVVDVIFHTKLYTPLVRYINNMFFWQRQWVSGILSFNNTLMWFLITNTDERRKIYICVNDHTMQWHERHKNSKLNSFSIYVDFSVPLHPFHRSHGCALWHLSNYTVHFFLKKETLNKRPT